MENINYSKGIVLSKIKVKNLIFPLILLFCMLNDIFGISIFGYVDELFGVISFLTLIVLLLLNKSKIILLFMVLFVIGLISYINSGYISSRGIALPIEDYFFTFKNMFSFCLILYLVYNEKFESKSLKYSYYMMMPLILLLFVITIYQFFIGYEKITLNGIYSGNVGYYSLLFGSVCCYNYCKERNRVSFLLILVSLVVCLFSKSGSSIVGFGLLLFLIAMARKSLLFKISIMVLLSVVVAIYFVPKFESYFLNEDAVRYILLSDSFKLLAKYFPWGTGPSLYGGKIAANYYSPIYIQMGYDSIWALRQDSNFLLDTYFPSLIAQYGFIGLIFLLGFFIFLIKKIFIKSKNYKRFITSNIHFYLFIFLISSGFVFNFISSSVGLSYSIVICMMFLATCKNRKNTNSLISG